MGKKSRKSAHGGTRPPRAPGVTWSSESTRSARAFSPADAADTELGESITECTECVAVSNAQFLAIAAVGERDFSEASADATSDLAIALTASIAALTAITAAATAHAAAATARLASGTEAAEGAAATARASASAARTAAAAATFAAGAVDHAATARRLRGPRHTTSDAAAQHARDVAAAMDPKEIEALELRASTRAHLSSGLPARSKVTASITSGTFSDASIHAAAMSRTAKANADLAAKTATAAAETTAAGDTAAAAAAAASVGATVADEENLAIAAAYLFANRYPARKAKGKSKK